MSFSFPSADVSGADPGGETAPSDEAIPPADGYFLAASPVAAPCISTSTFSSRLS